MKLVAIELEGYRRFDSKQRLDVDCRLVALLGPNEAGKTTVLRALQSLNNRNPYISSGPSQDVSRGKQYPPEHTIAAALFQIDSSDLTALKEIPESAIIKSVLVEKQLNGNLRYSLRPNPARDLALRKKVIGELEHLAHEQGSESQIFQPIMSVVNLISQPDAESLSKQSLDALRNLSNVIDGDFADTDLSARLASLVKDEEREPPARACEKLLARRMPEFILFSENDRDLKSTYDLAAAFDGKQGIPKALQNLAAATGLSLEELFQAAKSDDNGRVETLLSDANDSLIDKLTRAWNQSSVTVRFRLNAGQLTILVRALRQEFEAISERSDGLRQFVALFAFLSRIAQDNRDIVLLIDEAESRLHYDAQADLVQMLSRQTLAKKVIYTTHSIGCLPEDLGMGLRIVQPSEGSSVIVNKFWSKGSTGLSPLLLGMGAATMAFLPVRYCVLTEGPSDLLLLPALLRQATGVESLGFQISPGLAEMSEASVLRNEGHRVLFLVDGDDGGRAISAKLKKGGVSNEKILSLRHSSGDQCVIEDFVSRNAYVSAVNAELEQRGFGLRISIEDIPSTKRPAWLAGWCVQHEIPMPSKVDTAYKVLEYVRDGDITEPSEREQLRLLHNDIKLRFT